MTSSTEKVAIYVPSLGGGGAERVMATVASELADMGYHVDLLLARKQGPYLEDVSLNVNIVDFHKSRMVFTLPALSRYLWTHRPDVIMSAMGHTNIVTLAAAALSPFRPRVVVSERGSILSSVPGRKISKMLRILVRVLYPRADAIVAVSHGVRRDLHKYLNIPSNLIRTIYNPVDVERIYEQAQKVPQHSWLKGRHQVFIAVGRLSPVKDYETLLAAFSLISLQRPMARLIILGDGPSHMSLLSLAKNLGIEDLVDFVGFQANPYSWMAASDVYVLSSRSEGLPNALIQAMACRVRVVSTDCEHGPSEILAKGRWGRLVPVGDPSALAEAMSEALLDKSVVEAHESLRNFTIDSIIRQYSEVLGLRAVS